MKKVWKYIVITLLLLLGLCCVGILYLFFLPGSNLFNITYISKSDTYKSDKYSITTVNTIELNSRAYNVNILPTKEDEISIKVFSNSFGFVLVKNKDVEISSSLKSGVLTFDVAEPYGAAFRNNSYIDLYIPSSKAVNLTLNNKKSSTLIESEDLTIKNLTYKTQNGDFDLFKGTVSGNLDLTLGNSTFTIYEGFETNNNDVTLDLSTGKFDAEKSTLGDVTITHNKRGVVLLDECETLKEDVKTAGGRIEVNKLSHINVESSDTNIEVKEVLNGAIIELTKTGSIKINKLNGVSALTTGSGNITLNNTNSTLTLASDSGNITVKNAKYKVSAKSNYGDIKITFAEDAESYSTNSNARAVIANIKKGKIIVKGVENIKVTITDNGRAEINMKDIFGENYIDGKNGSVKVVVNKDSVYSLTTSSNTGEVKVNLTQIEEYNGYTQKTTRTTNVNCLSESANKFVVSTNYGDLTVLDTNFA